MLAVESLCEDAGEGGLADAPRPYEEIRMGDTPTLNRVLESARYMFLADDVRHLPGSPFSRKYFVCHASYYIKKEPIEKIGCLSHGKQLKIID